MGRPKELGVYSLLENRKVSGSVCTSSLEAMDSGADLIDKQSPTQAGRRKHSFQSRNRHAGVEERVTMGSIPDNDQPPFHLTDVDRAVIAQPDDQFQPQTWADLKCIIGGSVDIRRRN